MNTSKYSARVVGVVGALAAAATCVVGPAAGAPAPKPKPQPKPAVAKCSSVNPMFVIGSSDRLDWKVTAMPTPKRPGFVTFAGTGTAGARDVLLSQFSSRATLSWNNTTTGKYGSVDLSGRGDNPTLDKVVVRTGKGSVTYNVIISAGAGTTFIGTQQSSPCIGTVHA